MKPVIVRNLKVGEGKPKICVPIVGITKEDIINEAKNIRSLPVDVVEWRADWFESVFEIYEVIDTAKELRKILNDTPILFTFRTSKEGGKKDINLKTYAFLNMEVSKSSYIDMIDVEVFSGDDIVTDIIEKAHEYNVKVIASNHDFQKTPEKDDMIGRLKKMDQLGADILKIAVMPQSKKDVLTLLSATLEMSEVHTEKPLITMSMSASGVISRFAGECFGSVLTFGAASKPSAPGQINVRDLEQVLNIVHNSL